MYVKPGVFDLKTIIEGSRTTFFYTFAVGPLIRLLIETYIIS